MEMGIHDYQLKVKKYTEEITKVLEEVKKINDIEERCREISFEVGKHKRNLEELKGGKPEDFYDHYYPFNLDKYGKKVKELDNYWGEEAAKSNKIREQKQKEQSDKNYQLKSSHCFYCKKTPPAEHYIYSEKNKELKLRKRNAVPYKKEYLFCSETHFGKWYNKNYYSCDECFEEKWDGKYKRNKKNNQKFCSDHCFFTHYAEKCDDCLEKCVSVYQNKVTGFAQTYYSDPQNKTGILCSKCHTEKLKEESEERKKDKELEEICKRINENTDDLVEAMKNGLRESGKDKDNLEDDNSEEENSNLDDKSNQIKSNQIKSNQIKSNQIKFNLQTFQSNFIQSVELTTEGDLKIEYSNQPTSVVKPTSNPDLQKIAENMKKNNQTKLTKEELEQQLRELEEQKRKLEGSEEQKDKDSNLGLKVGIGVLVVVGLVSLIVAFIVKNRKKYD